MPSPRVSERRFVGSAKNVHKPAKPTAPKRTSAYQRRPSKRLFHTVPCSSAGGVRQSTPCRRPKRPRPSAVCPVRAETAARPVQPARLPGAGMRTRVDNAGKVRDSAGAQELVR